MKTILTHPSDGHAPREVCLACVEADARLLYAEEYKDEPDAPSFDEADGWEQSLFRRRAQARLDVAP